MTIPTRQAPPPPINQNRGFTITSHRNNQASSRYTPTTDWDDKPFGTEFESQTQFSSASSFTSTWPDTQQPTKVKKPAPPRPPPPKPKIAGPKPAVPLKKPSTLHSNTILSNLLSRARISKPNGNKNTIPPKLATPTLGTQQNPLSVVNPNYPSYGSTGLKMSNSFPSTISSSAQLISFDSPPGSPTFTQKSNSDCVSVDSFSSDSNYSPHNGFSSQAESGFEDDFVVDKPKYKRMTPVSDPFDILDEPFTQPTTNRSGNGIQTSSSSMNVGNTSFYAFSGNLSSINVNNCKVPSDNFDPLCNGKDLIINKNSRVMPTIIRPNSAGSKGKVSPTHLAKPKAPSIPALAIQQQDVSLDDSLPSLPMPSIPPPPPPEEFFNNDQDDQGTESYGIAVYDFDGEQDDDLSFKTNEKIYIMRRLNNEWLFGRNKRGCEGMFPANYLDIKIPLTDDSAICSGSSTPSVEQLKGVKVKALYEFHAETLEDLSLKVSP